MNTLRFCLHSARRLFIFLLLFTLPFYPACGGGFRGDNENADTFTKTIFHPEEIENDNAAIE